MDYERYDIRIFGGRKMTIEELSMMILFMNIGILLYMFAIWWIIDNKVNKFFATLKKDLSKLKKVKVKEKK